MFLEQGVLSEMLQERFVHLCIRAVSAGAQVRESSEPGTDPAPAGTSVEQGRNRVQPEYPNAFPLCLWEAFSG